MIVAKINRFTPYKNLYIFDFKTQLVRYHKYLFSFYLITRIIFADVFVKTLISEYLNKLTIAEKEIQYLINGKE